MHWRGIPANVEETPKVALEAEADGDLPSRPLRADAKTTSQIRSDSVIPVRQRRSRLEVELLDFVAKR
jgi:hypothetical protein